MTSDTEVLAVDLTPGSPLRWLLVASAPPRVVVVRADGTDLDEIGAHSVLAIVRDPDGSTQVRGDLSVLDGLDAGARLFVEAWRQSSTKTDRPGDGKPWDSPGFEAPDRPSR